MVASGRASAFKWKIDMHTRVQFSTSLSLGAFYSGEHSLLIIIILVIVICTSNQRTESQSRSRSLDKSSSSGPSVSLSLCTTDDSFE